MRLRSPATMRALMDQNGLSITDVAVAGRCSRGMISHLLSGRRSSCTRRLAKRITAALDVPLDVLFVEQVPSKAAA